MAPRSSHREWASSNCSEGFAGLLCAKCRERFKMSPTKACNPCATSNSILSPLLFVPVLLALAYFAFRKFLTFRRNNREKKIVAAQRLFNELIQFHSGSSLLRTSTGSCTSELSRQDLISGLRQLGLTVSNEVAHDLLESIDCDHSDSINSYEFEIWMGNDVSRRKVGTLCQHLFYALHLIGASVSVLQMALIVCRILVGLAQVVSKQPDAQQQDFPGPQWDSPLLAVFGFNFAWAVPVCTIDYGWGFLLNTLVFPLCLIGLVAVTWKFQTEAERSSQPDDQLHDIDRSNKRADYYFAFFLCCEYYRTIQLTGPNYTRNLLTCVTHTYGFL